MDIFRWLSGRQSLWGWAVVRNYNPRPMPGLRNMSLRSDDADPVGVWQVAGYSWRAYTELRLMTGILVHRGATCQ